MQKNDSFYIFSDGYFDQFGGPAGKKFKYKPFYDLLLTLQQLPMREQQKVPDNNYEEWRKGNDQVDDVLVIGFRVSYFKS